MSVGGSDVTTCCCVECLTRRHLLLSAELHPVITLNVCLSPASIASTIISFSSRCHSDWPRPPHHQGPVSNMTSHIQILQNPLTISQADLGIFKSTLLPSLQLHSGLAVVAYLAGRFTNRVELKDWLWPSGMVINALWSAIGRRVYNGITARQAWRMLPWSEKLILSTVTVWGTRLFYRIASRSLARGEDDPRYTAAKQEKGFWNNAIFSTFLPEALMQTVIALPFTMPFRSEPVVAFGADPQWAGVARSTAIGMFAAGMALEVLADTQIAQHKKKGRDDLCRDGVFSIVRHPKYVVPLPSTRATSELTSDAATWATHWCTARSCPCSTAPISCTRSRSQAR